MRIRSILLTSLFIIFCLAGFSQTASVKGKVTDAKGNPLSGATVKIKTSNNATTTDEQGIFILNNAPVNGTLIVSYVGHNTRDIKFTAGNEADCVFGRGSW